MALLWFSGNPLLLVFANLETYIDYTPYGLGPSTQDSPNPFQAASNITYHTFRYISRYLFRKIWASPALHEVRLPRSWSRQAIETLATRDVRLRVVEFNTKYGNSGYSNRRSPGNRMIGIRIFSITKRLRGPIIYVSWSNFSFLLSPSCWEQVRPLAFVNGYRTPSHIVTPKKPPYRHLAMHRRWYEPTLTFNPQWNPLHFDETGSKIWIRPVLRRFHQIASQIHNGKNRAVIERGYQACT